MPRCSSLPFTPALLTAALLAGCGTPPVPTATAVTAAPKAASVPATAASAPATAAATTPGARPAGPPAPGTPPPFAEVTKEAKSSDGFFTLWTKDEKTWLEIPADRLEQPFLFGMAMTSGTGDGRFWPGMLPGDQVALLRRVGNTLQLIARNQGVQVTAGTPLARAVGESYSDSLLAAAPLAAAPHPERKSLLVDANLLLGGDIAAMQTRLEASYRLSYGLDRGNSTIERSRTSADGSFLTFRQHFAIPRLPAPPVFAPGAPTPPPGALPNPPANVPDPRSLFIGIGYALTPLPVQAMAPRRADPRVGYFTESYQDMANDANFDRTHLIWRWRLEKREPQAALSPPKEPIRVVMDRNIPEKWRPTVRDAVLQWNKAFERAGFKDALVVEQQAADADSSVFEAPRVMAVRWFAQDYAGYVAFAQWQTDPRTGEIVRATVNVPENVPRLYRYEGNETRPALPAISPAAAWGRFAAAAACEFGDAMADELGFGHELAVARGDFQPGSPEAERFVGQGLADVVMHEVGHALGLRHNFRGSTGITPAQLRDAAFTASNGISNSVMDYVAVNAPLQGEPVADYHQTTLGAYDLWAIEWGYREFAADGEKAGLSKLAAQSDRDPALAYGTDEDAFGADPLSNQRDLGSDPLAFAQRRVALTRELWQRTATRQLAEDDDMTVYRRAFGRRLNALSELVPLAGKYLGGNYTRRSLAGAGLPLFTPVPAAQQRGAFKLILDEVFSSASFKFEPALMQRLGTKQLDRLSRFVTNTDVSLPNAVLGIQRTALDGLMSDALASRLADAEAKVDDPRTLLNYADVQAQLSATVWSELRAGAKARDIDSLRRNLQREHVRRLAAGLVRPASAAAADVRAVHRQAALQLEASLKAALAAPGWSNIVHAHLADSLATLSEALKAPLVKQGV